MKVSELIELLQKEDPNAEVHYSYNYGDHWRTQVAPTVDKVRVKMVEFSDYHGMDKLVNDQEYYEEELTRAVVVLS